MHTEFKSILHGLVFFYLNDYSVKYAIRNFIRSIVGFNVTNENDLAALQSYNVQYIISINDTFLSIGEDQWTVIQSLQQSELFEPVFSTQHFLIWRIY